MTALRVLCVLSVFVVGMMLSAGAAQAGVLTTLDFGSDRVDEAFSQGLPGVTCTDFPFPRLCTKDKTLAIIGHGTIEHVSFTATLSNPFSFGEFSLDLRHDGVTVGLGVPPGIGQGSVTITFDPLSAFNGRDASGDWTLRIGDNDGGDFSAYSNAVLAVTTPEPATLALFAVGFAGLAGTVAWRSLRSTRAPRS
jgi:PEP-CTERM motif